MTAEHVDTLIVTAGLSGIGAACPLEREQPGSLDRLPEQGATAPWQLHQHRIRDLIGVRRGPIDDEGICLSGQPPSRVRTAA